MSAELAKIVRAEALPYPLESEGEIESLTLAQERVPESLWHECDSLFGPAQGDHAIYVIVDSSLEMYA